MTGYIEKARRIRAALDSAIVTVQGTRDTEAIIKLREFIRPWTADK